MKLTNKIRIISSILLSGLIFTACEEDWKKLDLDSQVDIVDFTIRNRKGIVDDQNQTIVLSLPAGTTDLKSLVPTISISAGAVIVPASGEAIDLSSPVEYTVTSGSVYKTYLVTISALEAAVIDMIVDGSSAIFNEEAGEIYLQVNYGTDITNLAPVISLSEEASISPASEIAQDFSNPVTYTLTSGTVTKDYKVTTVVKVAPDMSKGSIGDKIGFIGLGADKNNLLDDDEQAAADWFFAEYPDGVYLSWDAIAGGAVNIYEYKVIWWHYDASSELPSQPANETIIQLFHDYLKDGGNYFFSGHACQYFWNIGRITNDFNKVIGNGGGFENGDTWTIGVNLPGADHRGHPIYKNIQFDEGDGFYTFPVLGPGWREDHNYVMVGFGDYYKRGNGDVLTYANFVQDLDAEWLGVWGGIRDYYMAGVLELKANETFKGKAIYIGIGGFEWNQNPQGDINPEGRNVYQDNINQVSKNSIEYLRGN